MTIDGRAAVDEHGKITVRGVEDKFAGMTDVSDDDVTTTDFRYGPPPIHDILWAKGWQASLRPPHLGANKLCVRAERFPKLTARILRPVTVVDLIKPSDVTGLTVGAVTSHSAKVSWNAATDNYGLAGYDVSVDGGAAHRTTVGTRSFTIGGLSPSTSHTVSVVAVDLGGNRSATPATASFTTAAAPPPADGGGDPGTGLSITPGEGFATASWHPDPAGDISYVAYLDGAEEERFTPGQYCSASPCTADSLVTLPVGELDPDTPYQLQIAALAADGTQSRMLSGTFSTPDYQPIVSAATSQLIASEASRCAALDGDFYSSPAVRGQVPVPAGSTQLFEGCYTVPDSSCIDAFLPPSGNKIMKCADDVTTLLYAVSPPGRGPVISGMEGVSPSLAPTDVLTEPVTWCVENVDTCTTIIETAAETAEVAGEVVAAGASTSVLVMAAAGIGIGVALGVLLAILFPTEIGINGIFEYPIDPDTDLDAFDNWGLDEGEWYNSLQMYAETIKTTKELAASDGLPMTWDDAASQQLKRTIDQACAQQRGGEASAAGCDPDVVVYVPGGVNRTYLPMLETGRHIVQALGDGGCPQPPGRAKWFYPAYSQGRKAAKAAGYEHNWYDSPAFLPNVCEGRTGTCDEFPFFSTNQAVDLSGELASLKVVPTEEQLPQAQEVGNFYSKCKVKDTDHFIVLPVKPWVEAKGPSFGFRVTPGGTSLCDPPNKPATTGD